MKRIFLLTFAALTLLAAQPARAWTYNDGDVLLVFRNGAQDVEFDVGSVTNFLGKTNGYTATVSNWDWSLVTRTFNNLGNVKVALLATGGTTNWLSSAEPNTTAYNVSSQGASSLHGVINAVGNKTLYPIGIPTAETNAYSIDLSGQYETAAYDYVVSGGHFSGISQLGGYAPFTVEQSIPGFLDFWSVSTTTSTPAPPDHLVGTFTIATNGVLTFVAGPRAATATSVTRSGNVSTVSFTTTVGNSYSVIYNSTLQSAVATWSVDGTTLTGNGSINSISHTNAGAAQEFYRINVQ